MKTQANKQSTPRRFGSVRELLASPEDQAVRDRLDQLSAQTRLVQELTLMRTRAGLTQAQLAAKMGCTQGRISKIESSLDADLTIGIVQAYARATCSEVELRFRKPSKQIARAGAQAPVGSQKPRTAVRAAGKTGLRARASARKPGRKSAQRKAVSV
jgi:transcriptional regulator with XRE-family HTH domain